MILTIANVLEQGTLGMNNLFDACELSHKEVHRNGSNILDICTSMVSTCIPPHTELSIVCRGPREVLPTLVTAFDTCKKCQKTAVSTTSPPSSYRALALALFQHTCNVMISAYTANRGKVEPLRTSVNAL
ncbi:hypothetical protein F2Q68_00042775 [Brassica cretica]|uniref:Uncharacterized protein n=1 Tax=Brassica cretica TaxID=69181 RepID=A0A8S9MAG8_BRACR|nr:hypothetical protein F2Q68_00042775 [Brassica cretica]